MARMKWRERNGDYPPGVTSENPLVERGEHLVSPNDLFAQPGLSHLQAGRLYVACSTVLGEQLLTARR